MGAMTLGLDIGGAHLKAARILPGGIVAQVLQVPCALWLGVDRLERALAEVEAALGRAGPVAVTMTGELADLFPDRSAGVARLLATLAAAWPGADLAIWAGRRGFVRPDAAREQTAEVASANWLASAALVARRHRSGLFVDIGSTTTDIVLVADGEVRAEGHTDRERLVSGELVYTGLTRTPVMAIAGEVPFKGRRVPVMNELFATTADVYRVLGLLPEHADQHDAADRGPKTALASARRLARMVGADLDDGTPDDWRQLAEALARAQLRRIEDAVALQRSRGLLPSDAPLIAAGCGRFLATRLVGPSCVDFADLARASGPVRDAAATCAPAVAVALLLAEAPLAHG